MKAIAALLVAAAIGLSVQPAQAAEMMDQPRRDLLIQVLERWHSCLAQTAQAIDQLRPGPIGPFLYVPSGIEAYATENARLVGEMIAALREGRSVSAQAWQEHIDKIRVSHCLSQIVQSYASYLSEVDDASRHGWDSPGPFRSFIIVRSPSGQLSQKIFDIPDGAAFLDQLVLWRFPKLQLAHSLGEVTIQTAARDENRRRLLEQITGLENQAESARRYLRSLEEEISLENLKLQAEVEYEQDRLAPFEATLKQAAEAAGHNLAPEVRSPTTAGTSSLSEADRARMQVRLAAIDRALDYLFAEENTNGASDVTRARIEALDQERAEIEAQLRAADRPREEAPSSSAPNGTTQAQASYEDALARYQSEAFISRKTLASLAITVEVKMEQKQRLLAEIAGHEARIAELEEQVSALGVGGVPPFSVLETSDASLIFDGQANSELAELARLIAEQTLRLRETERQHTEATKEIRQKADLVFDAALGARNATGWSYIAQAVVQAAIQVADNWEEAKGHPHVFVAMALSQMAVNLTIAKPTFYDVDIDQETGQRFIANMPNAAQRALSAAKARAVTGARPLAEHASMAALNQALQAASGSARLANLTALATARAHLGQAMAATPTRASAFSVAKAAILDVATEELKMRIAASMQEESIRAYLAAEEALGEALQRRTELSELLDVDRSLLKTLVAARAALRGGTAPVGPVQTAGIRIERNEAFDVEAGYMIRLYVSGEDKSVLETAQMQLAGHTLKKGTATGYFVIDAEVADKINAADLPEALPVTILVQ